MASRRKRFAANTSTPTNAHHYAAFIADVLAGNIRADRLVESLDDRAQFVLDYDDPDGLPDAPARPVRRPA